jgi:hypothetical protein
MRRCTAGSQFRDYQNQHAKGHADKSNDLHMDPAKARHGPQSDEKPEEKKKIDGCAALSVGKFGGQRSCRVGRNADGDVGAPLPATPPTPAPAAPQNSSLRVQARPPFRSATTDRVFSEVGVSGNTSASSAKRPQGRGRRSRARWRARWRFGNPALSHILRWRLSPMLASVGPITTSRSPVAARAA